MPVEYLLAENDDRFLTEDDADLLILEEVTVVTGEYQIITRRRRGRGAIIMPLLWELWRILNFPLT